MIERISDLPANVLGLSAHGRITGEDYETVVIPAVEEKLREHDKLRLLYYLGPDYEGFAAAAAWEMIHGSAYDLAAAAELHRPDYPEA